MEILKEEVGFKFTIAVFEASTTCSPYYIAVWGVMGDGETGRRGDWETGRLGDGETGRLGDGECGIFNPKFPYSLLLTPYSLLLKKLLPDDRPNRHNRIDTMPKCL
jgi:hypothetical protein